MSDKIDLQNDDFILVFDTNVFLHLYYYPYDESMRMLNVIKSYYDSIWLPYQVYEEFYRNRPKIDSDMFKKQDALKKGRIENI